MLSSAVVYQENGRPYIHVFSLHVMRAAFQTALSVAPSVLCLLWHLYNFLYFFFGMHGKVALKRVSHLKCRKQP